MPIIFHIGNWWQSSYDKVLVLQQLEDSNNGEIKINKQSLLVFWHTILENKYWAAINGK